MRPGLLQVLDYNPSLVQEVGLPTQQQLISRQIPIGATLVVAVGVSQRDLLLSSILLRKKLPAQTGMVRRPKGRSAPLQERISRSSVLSA